MQEKFLGLCKKFFPVVYKIMLAYLKQMCIIPAPSRFGLEQNWNKSRIAGKPTHPTQIFSYPLETKKNRLKIDVRILFANCSKFV